MNEDPVTIEKPEEVVLEEEVRVDEAAQQASEEEKTTLTATDDVTGAVVTVTGFLPEGLTLVVKHIDTGVIGGLAEDEFALLAVDISLVDAEGNEYEPVNNPDANFRAVSVMISHPSLAGIAEDETLVLYHVEETGTSQVASASSRPSRQSTTIHLPDSVPKSIPIAYCFICISLPLSILGAFIMICLVFIA